MCFVCLVDGVDTPAVCYVRGTSVCRDHIGDVAGADSFSFTHRLRQLSEQLAARKEGLNGG